MLKKFKLNGSLVALTALLWTLSVTVPSYAKGPGVGGGQGRGAGQGVAQATTAGSMPPGLAKENKTPSGLEKQNKTPAGWSKGKKKGWNKQIKKGKKMAKNKTQQRKNTY